MGIAGEEVWHLARDFVFKESKYLPSLSLITSHLFSSISIASASRYCLHRIHLPAGRSPFLLPGAYAAVGFPPVVTWRQEYSRIAPRSFIYSSLLMSFLLLPQYSSTNPIPFEHQHSSWYSLPLCVLLLRC